MRRTCHPFVTDMYKEDFNLAFTMYFKVLESKDVDSLEDEAELVSLTLDLSDHEDMLEDRCEVLKGLISKILTRYRGPAANSQRDKERDDHLYWRISRHSGDFHFLRLFVVNINVDRHREPVQVLY